MPTPPAAPAPDPEPTPRVDEPFAFDTYVGFSAFAAIKWGPENASSLFAQAMAAGYNTARVCAELRSWDRFGLPVVPVDIEAVDEFLDATARIPGAQVLLECICNLKEDGASKGEMRAWVEAIARLVADREYRHVALSPGNELWHPQSSIRHDDVFVVELLQILRETGQPVTVDDNFNPGRIRYNRAWLPHVDIPNAHPWRSPDPRRVDIRHMVERNGGRLLISEPTCYSETREDGACTTDRGRVRLYACRSKREGARWTFHADFGLWGQAPYPWFPEWSGVCG